MEEQVKRLSKPWIAAAVVGVLLLAAAAYMLGTRSGGRQGDIGEAQAKEIVLAHAGVQEADLESYRFELDTKNGEKVYELDFLAGGCDYEYQLTASGGEIIKFEKKQTPESAPVSNVPAPAAEGAEDLAKEIALTHAGVAESDISNYTCKADFEDGIQVYDIQFRAGALEYEYEIDPASGSVRKAQTEVFDAVPLPQAQGTESPAPSGTAPSTPTTPSAPAETPASGGNQGTGTASSGLIGEARAKAAALSHAGVAEGDIFRYTCKLDYENGVQVYEIDFHAGEYEYDYEINAATGAIVKSDKEWDDDYASQPTQSTAGTQGSEAAASLIGEAKAKSTALTHAGVAEGDIFDFKCKLDYENGVQVYEVEFKSGGYEYEYEIDAYAGTILKSDKDWD